MEEHERIASIIDDMQSLFGNGEVNGAYIGMYRDNHCNWYITNSFNGALLTIIEKGRICVRPSSAFRPALKEIAELFGMKLHVMKSDVWPRSVRVRGENQFSPGFSRIHFDASNKEFVYE